MRAFGAAGVASMRDSPAAVSFDALYEAHHVRLVRVAWLLLRDAGRAEELVQDAFVDLHQRWPGLRSPADAGGYLYVAVLNRSRSALRHLSVVHAAPVDRVEPEVSAETEALRGIERQRVLAALARLPRRQREVLVLRYYAQLSEAETANVLTISRGSVKSHASRGIRALRPLLGGPDEG